jgi:hypothetical protein
MNAICGFCRADAVQRELPAAVDNYLRPGIKHGNFTDQEEKLIVHLEALLGNRYEDFASFFISMSVLGLFELDRVSLIAYWCEHDGD